MADGGERARRASVFEVVGAWLHLWVPPRDVEIPPVPWRKLAAGTAAGLLVLGVALAILIPRIDQGKAGRAAAERAEVARREAANRRRIAAEQTPRHGSAAALAPRAGGPPGQRAAARAQLISRIQADVLADARRRAARGEMRKVEGPATCTPTQGYGTAGPVGVLDCFVVARRIEKTARTEPGAIGYPFRAIVDYRRFAYAWCKVEGIPGELSIPDPHSLVSLPTACRPPDG